MTQSSSQWDDITRSVSAMDRRAFLRFSTVATGLMATGVASVMPNAALAQVPDGIAHMTADEYAIWHRLMRALLPTDGSTLMDPQALPVLQTVDGASLATLPPDVLANLKGGVAFFNQAPTEAFGKPFIDLSEEEAAQFCDALASSEEVPARALHCFEVPDRHRLLGDPAHLGACRLSRARKRGMGPRIRR